MIKISKAILTASAILLIIVFAGLALSNSIKNNFQNKFRTGDKYMIAGICMTISGHRPITEEVELIYIHIGSVRSVTVRYELLTQKCE